MNGRKHFVKYGDSVSNTTIVGAATPQGTVSGPNDFKLVINDLTFNTCYVKYVDDTTVLSISKTVNDNTLQAAAICRECKPVLELPKACRLFLFNFPSMEKGHFYRFLCILTFTVNTAFLRLYFSDLTGKIPTVNVSFARSIPTFPHRNPVVFRLAVTVKSQFLASAVCTNFPEFVSNLSVIAGSRHGRRSKS